MTRFPVRGFKRFFREDGPARAALERLRHVFMPVAVALLIIVAWSSRGTLSAILENAIPLRLAAAVASWSMVHVTVTWFDFRLLRDFEHAIPFASIVRIYMTRLPAKYLPGGVWHSITRLIDLNSLQVPRSILTALAILQISLPASLAFILGGALLAGASWLGTGAAIATVSVPIAIAVLFLTPPLMNRTVLSNSVRISARSYLGAALAASCTWIFASAAFHLYLTSFPDLGHGLAIGSVAGAYLLSWGMGFISIFAPQGLGVFEVSAASLLPTAVPFQALVILVAGFRIVILLSDLLVWLASVIVNTPWLQRLGPGSPQLPDGTDTQSP